MITSIHISVKCYIIACLEVVLSVITSIPENLISLNDFSLEVVLSVITSIQYYQNGPHIRRLEVVLSVITSIQHAEHTLI